MRKAWFAAAAAGILLSAVPPSAGGERFDDFVRFGSGPGRERVSDMARDGDGNTYVVGYTSAGFSGYTNEGEADGYLAKIGPAGSVLWADQFGGADDDGENGLYAVALDDAGAVYVTGVSQQDLHATRTGYSDAVVRKYAADGRLLWGDQFGGADGIDAGFGVAVSRGQVRVVGTASGRGFLRTYSTAGSLLDSREEPGTNLWDVEAAGDDVYVVGGRPDDTGQGFVRRITSTSTSEVAFQAWAEPMRLAVSDATVAASGTTWGEGADTVVSTWDRELDPRWTSTGNVDLSCGCGQPVWALAIGPTGDVFAAGSADWPDGFVRKHAAATGERVWEVHLEAADWGVGGVAVEGDHVVFAGASSDGGGAFVASWPTTRTVPLTRLAGTDRIRTAVAISREAYPDGATSAVLVSARSFADGLVAGPVAAVADGPLLLVGSDLDPVVRDELRRLIAPGSTVTIVGGPASVTEPVEQAVRALGFDVERIAGDTRYATAVEAARRLGSPPAILADGLTFPDALVAGPAAVHAGQAVILTAGSSLPAVSRAYLLEVGSGHIAVGGPAATAAPGAETIVGTDRYDTANRVLARFFGEPHVVGVASGVTFSDALALVPLLGRDAAPVLLTPTDVLAATAADHLGLDLLEVYVAGGTAAVGASTQQQIAELLVEGGPFSLSSSPQFVNRLIPGRRPLGLVVPSGGAGVGIQLSATASPPGATVEVLPSVLQPGDVAEVWVDVPEVTEEVPLSVTVTGRRDGVARTTAISATATPGEDDLEPVALDIADRFLQELAGTVPGLPAEPTGLTGGTPVAGLLVVSHYAWFTDDVEIGLAWHIMVAPDDWAELYVRPRSELSPTHAFRLSSWSTALDGGEFTVTEIPPPPEVTR